MKNTKRVDENNEYVTKGFLKEIIDGATVEIINAVGDRFDGRMDRLEDRIDGLENKMVNLENKVDSLENKVGDLEDRVQSVEANMITKSTLLKIQDDFVSRSEFNGLSARVHLVEETVYE